MVASLASHRGAWDPTSSGKELAPVAATLEGCHDTKKCEGCYKGLYMGQPDILSGPMCLARCAYLMAYRPEHPAPG